MPIQQSMNESDINSSSCVVIIESGDGENIG